MEEKVEYTKCPVAMSKECQAEEVKKKPLLLLLHTGGPKMVVKAVEVDKKPSK